MSCFVQGYVTEPFNARCHIYIYVCVYIYVYMFFLFLTLFRFSFMGVNTLGRETQILQARPVHSDLFCF